MSDSVFISMKINEAVLLLEILKKQNLLIDLSKDLDELLNPKTLGISVTDKISTTDKLR